VFHVKGQYFSFDAIIGSVIFVLALIALLSYWHSVRSFLDYQNDPLSSEVTRVSNLLFVPPPPSDCVHLTKFGLAVSFDDPRVNSSIIKCINDTKDEKWLQGALGTPYNVSIEVTDISGNTPTMFLGGQVPTSKLMNVVKMRRLSSVVNPDGTTYLAAFDLTMYD